MGITIDESIENLVLLKKLEDSLGNISANTNSVASQSLECAVDTMRKYQIIQKVLEKVWNTPSCILDEAECLNEIMETYRTVR